MHQDQVRKYFVEGSPSSHGKISYSISFPPWHKGRAYHCAWGQWDGQNYTPSAAWLRKIFLRNPRVGLMPVAVISQAAHCKREGTAKNQLNSSYCAWHALSTMKIKWVQVIAYYEFPRVLEEPPSRSYRRLERVACLGIRSGMWPLLHSSGQFQT